MSGPSRQPDLDAVDDDIVRQLGAALKRAAFDEEFFANSEAIAPQLLEAVRRPMVLWSLREQPSPTATLARLFAYDDHVSAQELGDALEPALVEALTQANLLRATDDGIASNMRLIPFYGLLVASDPLHLPDPVMGPGDTTAELARAMPSEDLGSVLDVGCGAGSLALLAASRGAAEVVGVDVDPRAIQWSRLNATLNDLSIELHEGDLATPVKDRRFDLVISQPPFVAKPEAIDHAKYLHGGPMGDEIALRLFEQLPSMMNDSGHALVLFDSPVRDDSALWERVAAAHESQDIQALLFTAPGNSPNIQSIGYAAGHYPQLGPDYAACAVQYREHFKARAIEQCEHVLATIRRVPGEPPMSVVIEQPRLSGLGAAAIAETWKAVGLASQPDEDLLLCIVGLPEGTWLVHEEGDGEQRLKIRLPAGRGDEEELSDAAALLVDLLRQPVALNTVVQQYASACGATTHEVRESVLDFVRQSLISGRLVAVVPSS